MEIDEPTRRDYELTHEDLRLAPIWIYSENILDEDEVIPYDYPISGLEQEQIYYISAKFQLADGSCYVGKIRVSYGTVTTLELSNFDDVEHVFSRIKKIQETLQESAVTFASRLDKTKAEVFPIYFSTPFKFEDNSPLSGYITAEPIP